MELPAHPEPDDTPAGEEPATRVNWAMVLVFGLIAALVAGILVLHLTGVVGPTGH